MAFGKYVIKIFDYLGAYKTEITDFESLRIQDAANSVGMWKVTSTTKENPPFAIGDSIRVYRDGVNIYNGIFTKLVKEYVTKYHSWTWSASGGNHNQILKWKLAYPPSDWYGLTQREYVSSGHMYETIIDLIKYNAQYASENYRNVAGFYLVKDAMAAFPVNDRRGTISLRFDNLFSAVTSLANRSDNVILAVPDNDNRVIYYVSAGSVVANVIFDDKFNQVESFKHTLTCPEATHVVMSYDSDDEVYKTGYGNAEMWQLVENSQISGEGSWAAGQAREIFVKPKEEDFEGSFSVNKLRSLCESEARGMNTGVDAYEVTINPLESKWVYGYDYEPYYNTIHWLNDYRIGDVIGLVVDGITYSGKVTGMEFDVSYGKETIKPVVGSLYKGKFNSIFWNLNNLNASTTKTDNTGVAP